MTHHTSFRALDKQLNLALSSVNDKMSVKVAKTFGLKEVVELNVVADMVDSLAAELTDKYITNVADRTPQLSSLMAVIIMASQQMLAIQYTNTYNEAVRQAAKDCPGVEITDNLRVATHALVMSGSLKILRDLPNILSGVVDDMIGDTLLEFVNTLELNKRNAKR